MWGYIGGYIGVICLRALGGTLNGDPCSLLGVVWVIFGDI